MMHSYVAVPVAFCVTIALVPVITRFCEHTQILDHPGALKIHNRAVPRLGGIAIYAAILTGTLISDVRGGSKVWLFYAALSLIWFVGLLDDIRGLSAIFRLVAQVFASFLLWAGGGRLSGPPPVFASIAANCCLVVLFVNAFNWWDGMDGLAAGTACVTAVCYALLPSSAMSPLGFATALSLAGTCAAFLLFNWHPRASIFLGDCGSTVLGFLIVCFGLDFSRTQSSSRASVLFMLVLAALPVLDAARVIACRIVGGGSALQGDRTHFYDLILKSGYSARRIAVLSWSVTALFGALAVFIERRAASELWLLALLALVAVWLVANAALSRKNANNYEVSEPI